MQLFSEIKKRVMMRLICQRCKITGLLFIGATALF
jgi:ribosomal protein L40E